MTAYYDKQLVLMEQERREVQAALNRNVAEFRKEHQVRAVAAVDGAARRVEAFPSSRAGVERAILARRAAPA